MALENYTSMFVSYFTGLTLIQITTCAFPISHITIQYLLKFIVFNVFSLFVIYPCNLEFIWEFLLHDSWFLKQKIGISIHNLNLDLTTMYGGLIKWSLHAMPMLVSLLEDIVLLAFWDKLLASDELNQSLHWCLSFVLGDRFVVCLMILVALLLDGPWYAYGLGWNSLYWEVWFGFW